MLHLAYLNNFFLWTRVMKHNQYVEIKQFFKVCINSRNIILFIWLIKFLVYQVLDPRLLEEVVLTFLLT